MKNRQQNNETKKPSIITELTNDLDYNLDKIKSDFADSMDLLIRKINFNNLNIALIMCEGMISLQTFSELIVEPLLKIKKQNIKTPDALFFSINSENVFSADQPIIYDFESVYKFIMSGFVVILIDDLNTATACGAQGFSFRSISEPETQVNVRGSKEGFVEALRINMTLIRRRIKSPKLKFELLSVGEKSKTDVVLCYMTDIVSKELLNEIKKRISNIKIDILLESGYIQPFLDKRPFSLFSGIGTTERPDSMCAKIIEGRIGILVDGTPFALIAPYLFSENFQSIDDYTQRPYYATFIRLLKYFSFFLTILLPGLYVAIVSFHPELLPKSLLFHIAFAEASTPFPLVVEALIIHIIYEIMREAGLRMPRAVGHAVSIVGALVIGETAVSAGLIGSPMVLIVALTAISSFVVPSVYEAVSVLRISFIIIGGYFGILGINLALCIVGVNMCSINPLGVPFTAPISPLNLKSMRDTFVRVGWRTLSKRNVKVQDLPGSEIKK